MLVYLYNPFSADLLERVMRNLAASLKRHPRPCQIVYTTGKGTLPWAVKSIEESGPFALIDSGKTPLFLDAVRTMDYAIFRATIPPGSSATTVSMQS